MTVSYIIIIVIIWKKSLIQIKDQIPLSKRSEKSKTSRLISPKTPNLSGEERH